MSIPILANYEEERAAFRSLLHENCEQRLLFFEGASGTGKTSLLRACQQEIPGDFETVPIQFRDSSVNVAEIFDRVGELVGWETMTHFTEQIAALSDLPTLQVQRNWQTGSNNQIHIALHADSLADKEQRRVQLTKAWLTDLQAITHPLLLIMDTYEQATTDVVGWIEGPFLTRAARLPQLRILLAGQHVPDAHNIEWGSCCHKRDLYGVQDARHWMPVVAALNRSIDAPGIDPFSWLAGICHALKGRPSAIMKVIESLPRRGVTA